MKGKTFSLKTITVVALVILIAFSMAASALEQKKDVVINTYNMNQYETFAYHSSLIAGYRAQGMAVTANPYRASVYRIEVLYGGRLSQAEIYFDAIRVRGGLPHYSEMKFVPGGPEWKPVYREV